MNLNEIKEACKTEPREVEFIFAGEPTGWFFTLRHESAREVQEVTRRFQSKVRDLTLKRKANAQKEAIAQHEDDLRIAHVVSWRWNEGDDEEAGRPAFSKKELKEALNHKHLGYHLKQFIDEEVGSLEDFLARSEDS